MAPKVLVALFSAIVPAEVEESPPLDVRSKYLVLVGNDVESQDEKHTNIMASVLFCQSGIYACFLTILFVTMSQ